MDFHINKKSTLPLLRLELIKDGRNNYNKFHELIQNSDITFCMTEVETGQKFIGNKDAMCILKETDDDCPEEEYYIAYQFSAKETRKAGTYVGEFNIVFLDGSGTLKTPIRETLYIHVHDHGIKK